MLCSDHLYRATRPASSPAAGSSAVRRRPRRRRPRRRCSRTTGTPRDATRSPRSSRTSPRRRSGSSSSSWPGPRRHLELFDNKPELAEMDGKLPPPKLSRATGPRSSTRTRSCLGPKFKFAKHGKSGAELSELLPHTAKIADDIAIVKSMATDAFNHAPGQILMNTGAQQFGRPSFGAWTLYGLGSESQRPAGVRRLQHRQQGAERRELLLGQRVPAHRLQRASSSAAAASRCCTCPTRRASTPSCRRTRSTPINRAEQAAARRDRRPGDRHPHRRLRDGRTGCRRPPRR